LFVWLVAGCWLVVGSCSVVVGCLVVDVAGALNSFLNCFSYHQCVGCRRVRGVKRVGPYASFNGHLWLSGIVVVEPVDLSH
jgi:hypothetical protein